MQTNRILRRVGKELQKLQDSPLDFATVELAKKNELLVWTATLQGPKGSPYEGGKFKVKLDLQKEYPYKAPVAQFITKVYHPGVNRETGDVCAELLAHDWKPQMKLSDALTKIHTMLGSPDPHEHVVDEEVAEHLRKDQKGFEKTAKDWTKKHAK